MGINPGENSLDKTPCQRAKPSDERFLVNILRIKSQINSFCITYHLLAKMSTGPFVSVQLYSVFTEV